MATKVPMATKVTMATKRSLAVLASYEIWACFSFFHCIFRKIPVSDPKNQSFLEEKFYAPKKTEIR